MACWGFKRYGEEVAERRGAWLLRSARGADIGVVHGLPALVADQLLTAYHVRRKRQAMVGADADA